MIGTGRENPLVARIISVAKTAAKKSWKKILERY